MVPYDLAYFVSNGTERSFELGVAASNPRAFAFSTDGLKLFILAKSYSVVEFTLTTPYDLTTAIHAGAMEDFQVGGEESNPTGIAFNHTGSKMYIVGITDDSVVEYTLTTPFDVSTSSYAGIDEEFYIGDEVFRATTMLFNNDGSKMFVGGSNYSSIWEFSLPTPYDVSTAIFNGDGERLDAREFGAPYSFRFNNEGIG